MSKSERTTQLKKWRELFETYYGEIPDEYEIHHILPERLGGKDKWENLELIPREEHAQRHLELYEKYGDFRDLCAYYMIGYNFSEAHKISSSEGGKIGGKVTKEKGIGIFSENANRKEWASLGGKAAQKTLEEKQTSAFYDPNLKQEICSKGGKKGAFTQSKWQSEFGKRGGVKNKGFKWYTDGENSYKYTREMQENKSFEEFLKENPQFRKGRKKWK